MPVHHPEPESPTVSAFGMPEHLLRHEWGKLVAILTSILGVRHVQLAEDVVQEAMVKAFNTWPYHGVPDNPSAWLARTAKNLALDTLRREQSFREKEPEIIRVFTSHLEAAPPFAVAPADETLPDPLLALIFACCAPVLPEEHQVALALKTICGFSNREIARAFLVHEAAMAKRLTRARTALRDAEVPFGIPEGPELTPRLGAVLRTLYLMFSEGHSTSEGDQVIRQDLCYEAIRLADVLANHPATQRPETDALLALFLLNAARLPARICPTGKIIRLEHQDRTLWDDRLIQRGMRHLALATTGDSLSEYHLQAAISACHSIAPSDAETDWPRILSLYDDLMRVAPSPVIMLNRAVAVAKVHGPQQAIVQIQNSLEGGSLAEYPLIHAVLGHLKSQNNRPADAAVHFRRALALASSSQEKSLFASCLQECLSNP